MEHQHPQEHETEPEYQEFTVCRRDMDDLTFDGVLLATVSSSKDSTPQNQERWSVLNLYRTRAGSYVCEEIGMSTFPGEIELTRAEVAHSVQGVIKFFGHKWLAKQLYSLAKLKTATRVA